MTALSIQPPYPIFTEADGSPLENGFVYIGTANLDPVANPIAVYWDAALTIPAAQPIRTLNGYPSRNGTPSAMYVAGDYSITVINAKGGTIYTAASATSKLIVFPKTMAEDTAGGATDVASYNFRRRATYSGGTPGFVNSAIRADTYVESFIGSQTSTAASYEWAITGVVWNYSNAGENVGGYFQGRKYSTGATWGAVIEVLEYNNPGGNPTQQTVGLELDVNCNGPDTNAPYGSRVGLDMAIRKTNAGGSAAEVAWGYRIQGDTGAKVDRGYSFYPGMTCNKAFDASTATCIQAAYVMAENQIIGFNGNLTRQLTHNGGGYIFKSNLASQWALNDDGSLVVLGTQLLGSRRTGWGAPTGTATRTAFATSTVTTAQLAERVKALIDDLTTHGLIGA